MLHPFFQSADWTGAYIHSWLGGGGQGGTGRDTRMDTGQTTTWKSFASIHSLYPYLNLTSFFLPTKYMKTTP